jgi:hypothetical protein
LSDLLTSIEVVPRALLLTLLDTHAISIPRQSNLESLCNELSSLHLSSGACATSNPHGCAYITSQGGDSNDDTSLKIFFLSKLVPVVHLRPLRRIISQNHVVFDSNGSLFRLRRELRKYITRLKHGKRSEDKRAAQIILDTEFEAHLKDIRESWPQKVDSKLKRKIVNLFRQQTSKEDLATFTCSACAESTLCSENHKLLVSEIDTDLLTYKPQHSSFAPPLPYNDGPLKDVLLEAAGITADRKGDLIAHLCKTCYSALKKTKLPPLSCQ